MDYPYLKEGQRVTLNGKAARYSNTSAGPGVKGTVKEVYCSLNAAEILPDGLDYNLYFNCNEFSVDGAPEEAIDTYLAVDYVDAPVEEDVVNDIVNDTVEEVPTGPGHPRDRTRERSYEEKFIDCCRDTAVDLLFESREPKDLVRARLCIDMMIEFHKLGKQ